jgi:nitrite reductase/ring-hydroxylating ferredoxin subunit
MDDRSVTPEPDAVDARAAERFDHYVDAVLGAGRPSPDDVLDRDEAEMARLAAELSGATDASADPDDAFLEQLRLRMRQADQGIDAVRVRPAVRADVPDAGDRIRRFRLSRRDLLRGGLTAGAGLAAGLVGGTLIDRAFTDAEAGWTDQEVVGGDGEWAQVATTDDLPEGAVVRFTTPAFDGFVVNDGGEIRALGSACTHLGCTLHYRREFNDLRCPCHGASFNLRGWLANDRQNWQREGPYPGDVRAYPIELPPLPRPKVKVEEDKVFVYTARI